MVRVEPAFKVRVPEPVRSTLLVSLVLLSPLKVTLPSTFTSVPVAISILLFNTTFSPAKVPLAPVAKLIEPASVVEPIVTVPSVLNEYRRCSR